MKKVLIIEDETALLYALSTSLNVDGFEVITASDGKEGLELAEKNAPNLVILDLRLPGMDGFEVLEKLKQSEKTKKIPVMIVTNLGEKETQEECKKLGADEYILKADHSLDEIVDKVKAKLK